MPAGKQEKRESHNNAQWLTWLEVMSSTHWLWTCRWTSRPPELLAWRRSSYWLALTLQMLQTAGDLWRVVEEGRSMKRRKIFSKRLRPTSQAHDNGNATEQSLIRSSEMFQMNWVALMWPLGKSEMIPECRVSIKIFRFSDWATVSL